MDSNASVQQRKRRRPALACEQCRRRKIKCDRETPCDQCTRSKSELCTYIPDERHNAHSGTRRASLGRSLASRSASPPMGSNSPSHTEILPVNGMFDSRANQASSTRNSMKSKEVHTRGQGLDATSGLEQRLNDRMKLLEQKILDVGNLRSGESTAVSSWKQSARPSPTPPMRGIFSKTRLFGQSHWMNSAQQYGKILELWRGAEADESSKIRVLLDKCKYLARTAKTQGTIYPPIMTDLRSWVPLRETSDQLVHSYLQTFESVYRILHIPTFQHEYNQYWINPQSANEVFVIKLLLVMAIGTSFYEDSDTLTSLRLSSSQWIYAAQSWLVSPSEKSRLNLSGLQIHCLLLLARQTNAIAGDLIWISAGSLIRTAVQMGLHRDPRHLPRMPIFHAEIRRRLWATVLEIVVQSSMDSGGPPLISCEDFDCESPSNINDGQIDESTKLPPVSKSLDTMTQTSVQIALMRTLPIRLEVTKLINDFRSDPSYDDVLCLGAELTSAYRANSLSSDSLRTNEAQPSAFQTKLLGLLTHRFLLALHQPFALKARTNLSYYYSRKICLESSLLLLSDSPSPQNLDSHLQNDHFTRLKRVGGGPFRGVLLHAAANIGLELITQLQEQSSSFMSESNIVQRKELHKAIEGYIELTICRIKAGETNVKGHIFFSCVMAQINAMHAGTSLEESILEALNRSTETSYQLLKAKTEDSAAQRIDENAETQQDIGFEVLQNGFEWSDLLQDFRTTPGGIDPWSFLDGLPIENGPL